MVLNQPNEPAKHAAVFLRLGQALPLIGLLALLACHFVLISKTLAVDPDGSVRTLGYGDIQLHLAHVTNFAARPFDFQDPLFFGAPLQYPFAINYLSGLLLRLTGAMEFSFLLPVLALAAANLALAFRHYRRLTGSAGWAFWALMLFLFGSGFGAWNSIVASYHRGQTFREHLRERIVEGTSTMVRLDAQYPDQSIVYGAPANLAFFDQRAFFAGFFLFLLTLTLLSGTTRGRWQALGAGLAIGLLPLAHTHSFIALAITMVVWWLIELWRGNGAQARAILVAGLIGAALSTPQLVYLIRAKQLFTGARPFLHWRLGWMMEGIGHITHDGGGVTFARWLQFLWVNLGVLPLMFLAALVIFGWRRWRAGRRTKMSANTLAEMPGAFSDSPLLLPSAISVLALFVVVNLIQFQPWDFDNNKLLVYAQFFAAPLAALFLRTLWRRGGFFCEVGVNLLLITALLSGMVDALPRLRVPRREMTAIFNSDDVALARFIREKIPAGGLILTPAHRTNPALSLAGRPALLGSPSWLWTWGVPFEEREKEIKRFYASPAQSDLPSLDDTARREYAAQTAVFDELFVKIYQHGPYSIYQL
jgi:hypothetical protein